MALRLNLGSGDQKIDGFTSVDLYDPVADVKADLADLPFDNDSVDEIVCYQTIEHIPYHQTEQVLREMRRVLKSGGTAVIECPDIEYAAHAIIEEGLTQKWLQHIYGEYHRPWDVGRYGEEAVFWPGGIHYQGFTFERMEACAHQAGFNKIRRREVQEILEPYRYPETLSVELTKE